MASRLRERLIEHESYEKYPYSCSAEKLTIGVGHNLTDRGLPDHIIDQLLNWDIEIAIDDLEDLDPNWASYSTNRQDALIELSFALGKPNLTLFKKMWAAIKQETPDWEEAAAQLLDSKFATQVGKRAHTLADLLRSG
ncbi:MAG: lysozyme [Alteromonadaceae bacterium]|nr:lysozyme [Alteromonadaceae bacterium]